MIDTGADAAPRSAHDAFVLSAARARAGAILTTGANIRAEAFLRHEPFGAGAQALREWRCERVTGGQNVPPHTIVLTRDSSLDLGHPLFTDADVAVHVLTDRAAALGLRQQPRYHDERQAGCRLAPRIIELSGRALTNPASPIVFARSLPPVAERADACLLPRTVSEASSGVAGTDRPPAGDVLLECGVTTVRPLYGIGAVDELLLSVYRGSLDKSARSKPFLSWEEIRGYFGTEELRKGIAQQYSVPADLHSRVAGRWSFLRFRFRSR